MTKHTNVNIISPPQSPKVLFLDIGGVLLTNGWGHESRKKAAEAFDYDYSAVEPLHALIFSIYEIGRISLDEYLERTVFCQPRSFSRKAYKEFMFAQSELLPNMANWLKDWRLSNPGISIISINNEGRELNQYRIEKFGMHDIFHAFISSCEVGLRKPDPQIFKLALGIAQVKASECLYFDDHPMLVGAAKQLGIPAFQHQSFLHTQHIIQEKINKNDT